MLLDEPTNHLDIDARAALIQALNGYDGCVILVSHDPHLVEAVADRLLLVKDGSVKPYHDDLEAYRELVVEQRRRERAGDKKKKKDGKKAKPNSDSPEKTLARCEQTLAAIEAEMALPQSVSNPATLKELSKQYDAAQSALDAAEAAWLEAQEAS
jgi:ATP-binding cassette subfamily F protein 3